MQEKENEQSNEQFFEYKMHPSEDVSTTHYTSNQDLIPKNATSFRKIGIGAVFGVIDRYTREGKKYKLLRVQKSSQPENIKEKIFSFHGTFAIEVPDSNPSY